MRQFLFNSIINREKIQSRLWTVQFNVNFQDSGLSDWLGNELKVFADNEPWVMNLIFTFIITAATGVTSNTAMATLLMPILSSVVSIIFTHVVAHSDENNNLDCALSENSHQAELKVVCPSLCMSHHWFC